MQRHSDARIAIRHRRTGRGRPLHPLVTKVLCVLMGLWLALGSSTPGLAKEGEGVRTGVTRVEARAAAEGAEVGAAAAEPAAPSAPRSDAPGDAPRAVGAPLKLPHPPAGYHSHDGHWIQFHYPPDLRQRVQPLIAQADAAKASLAQFLGQPLLTRVSVRIARTPEEMASLAPEGAPFPSYADGVAYSELGLILLTIQPVQPNTTYDLPQVFRHELAHVALYDAVGGKHVPRWFNEGFAVNASGESSLARHQSLMTATLANRLMPLSQLDRRFPASASQVPIAYAQAADLVRFMHRRQDRERFSGFVSRLRSGKPFAESVAIAYGIELDELEGQWRDDVAKRYTFWPVLFSSTVVWTLAIGLFVWGWRRRKKRDRETLRRWEREEIAARPVPEARAVVAEQPRLHVVLARPPRGMPAGIEAEVPKVEHNGQWHTLH